MAREFVMHTGIEGLAQYDTAVKEFVLRTQFLSIADTISRTYKNEQPYETITERDLEVMKTISKWIDDF